MYGLSSARYHAAGTSTTYDGLGRTLTTTDPLQKVTTTSHSTEQPLAGANITDTAWYDATSVIDANSHEHITLTDGLGRTRYVEQLSGNGTQLSPYALYGTTSSVYDWLGDVVSVTGPADYPTAAAGLNASAQTTTSYDLLGRTVGMSDADLGSGWQYTYDPDGNVLSAIDARGTSGGGAVYASYDGLDRPLTRSTTSDGSSPYVTYTYDSTANGNDGKGHLTSESFTGGTPSDPLSGGYAYAYDGRGQVTAWTQTITGGTPYTLQTAYNDAGQPSSLTYSDGEVMTPGYNSDGWLTSATTVPSGQGGSQVNLLTNIGYSGVGGAAMHPTSASVGNGTYSYSASYDNDLRLSSVSENLVSPSLTLFSSTRTYDAVGNVATVATTLAAGTDNQQFCYDEQNRLVWAGSTGTPPCTGTAITPGSLTAANYTASYSYDAMNRLTSAPTLGSYSYGTTPVHAATSTTSGGSTVYSASYDAVGDMVCRAPSSATTCTGTPTGQQLQYDAERRVTHWQSSPSSPTSSADYLYDGSGNRVEQVDTSGGTSTQVYYLFGGVEEISSTGGTSTLTKYYSAAGLLIGENVGGTISYLASDGLGSVSEALSTSGTATAGQLYGPYGGVRYSSGTMPTAKGFTGQRADAISGLDYYGARYYDPVLGQFASADTKQGPNRFAYVADDPETLTDPTGHLRTCMEPPCGGGGGGSGGSGGSGGGNGDGGGGSGSGGGNGTCNASCYAQYHHRNSGGSEFSVNPGCEAGGPGCPIIGSIAGGVGPAISAVGGAISAIAWAIAAKAVCPTCKTPTQAQVNNAKQVASDTADQFCNAIVITAGLLAIYALFMVTNPKCAFCGSAVGALTVVLANLTAVWALFNWESKQGDSFWDNPAKLLVFQLAVHAAVTVLGASIAAFATSEAIDSENAAVVAAGGGTIAGALLSLGIFPLVDSAMAQEKEDLGYPL